MAEHSQLRLTHQLLHLHNSLGPLDPSLRRAQPSVPALLMFAQPRLQRFTNQALAQEVDDLSNDDEHKGNRVHPVNRQMEDLDADSDTPERSGEEGDVEERRAGKAEQNWCQRVEERKDKRVSREIPANLTVPCSTAERCAVENPSLRAIDEHGPERQLSHNLIERALTNKPFLENICKAVESSAQQGEKITLDLICSTKLVGACDLVGSEDYAQSTDAE